MKIDLTEEWLFEKGFTKKPCDHASYREWVFFKDGICIEADFDGWFLMDEEDLISEEPQGYNLGTKPHWTYQVELLHEAITGTKL